MFQRITKISFIFLGIAFFGLLAATMHYHSDAILCLEHGDEAHYTQNGQLCPVSVLNLNNDAVFVSFNVTQKCKVEPVVNIPVVITLPSLYLSDFGRAPPFLA